MSLMSFRLYGYRLGEEGKGREWRGGGAEDMPPAKFANEEALRADEEVLYMYVLNFAHC